MRTHHDVLVLASLCLLFAAVAARPPAIQAAVVPAWVLRPPQEAAPAVKPPDTPSGRALAEFVESFNAGGKTRETWLETRTTLEDEPRANILKTDAQLLEKLGPLTVVRIINASQEAVEAVVRHGKSNMHGVLAITVETAAPFTVANFGLRPATPEEIAGGGGK